MTAVNIYGCIWKLVTQQLNQLKSQSQFNSSFFILEPIWSQPPDINRRESESKIQCQQWCQWKQVGEKKLADSCQPSLFTHSSFQLQSTVLTFNTYLPDN